MTEARVAAEEMGQGSPRTDTTTGHPGRATVRAAGGAEPIPLIRPPRRFRPGPRADVPIEAMGTRNALLSRRDSMRRRLLAVADVLALAASFSVVAVAAPRPYDAGALAATAAIPLWVLLNKLLGLYDRDANVIHTTTLDELPRLLHSIALGAGLIYLLAPLIGVDVSRSQTLVFIGAAVVAMPLLRSVTRAAIVRLSQPERALIVGSGSVGRLVARKIRAHPEYGVNVVGFVDVSPTGDDDDGSLEFLGDLEQFNAVCRQFDVERVVIAFSSLSHEHLLDAIRSSRLSNLKITVVPRLFEVMGSGVEIDQVEGMTMLGMRSLCRTRSSLMLKRAADVAGSLAGLVLVAPLMLSIAVAIKLTSPGPVFFSQERIGRGNRPFKIWKFRTMVDGADAMKEELRHLSETPAPMFKMAEDPRVTRVGRMLRRSSLDELPQLFNVLRGEMSLVGPRPLVPSEDEHVIGWHRARLDLTPGLTGPWQVLGRTNIPFHEMVKLDYLYANDWSLWNDVKLLVRTAPVLLKRGGC